MSLDHTHEHVFLGSAHEENAKRTLWVVMLTVVMMVAEIAAGALTGSMALLADGFHMATHAGALGIAAAAYAYARRHASSPRFSFGTGKVGDRHRDVDCRGGAGGQYRQCAVARPRS